MFIHIFHIFNEDNVFLADKINFLISQADLDMLTESRRHSTAVLEEEQTIENFNNIIGKSGYLQIVVNLDIVLLLIISCVSFMIGFVFDDFSFYQQIFN